MHILFHSSFWVALGSGALLTILFFVAWHMHKARDTIYNQKLRSVGTNGPPPDMSDLAEHFIRKRRSFRAPYFFYTLYLAYATYR